ncbi:diguanylate cyclase domain-containing protein [Marinomonas ostreistagni]|nr:diguanylate cyclase [Marinomonas ostreistagni]
MFMGYRPTKFKLYLNAMLLFVFLMVASLAVVILEQSRYEKALLKRDYSVGLVEELRQSSNDLAKLSRNYVTTLDPVYKSLFIELVGIRNGTLPRPKSYSLVYWDLNIFTARDEEKYGEAVPLLDLLRDAGLTDDEWRRVVTAKYNSDALVGIELRAMELVDEDTPVDFDKRNLAFDMLADDYFVNTKVDIMKPIFEAEQMIISRTQAKVDLVKRNLYFATMFLLVVSVLLTWCIFKTGQHLKQVIGCSIPELQRIIKRLGKGDFLTAVSIDDKNQESVLGWLAKTQRSLATLNLAHFRAIVDSSDDAIISKNIHGIIASWNQGAVRLFGYSAEEMIGKPLSTIIPEERQHEEPEILAKIARGEKVDHFETQRLHKDGSLIDLSVTISPIFNSEGEVIGASKIARDISKAKAAEAEIHRLVYFDTLTGLANRRFLYSKLPESCKDAVIDKTQLAVFFLDLDNFKPLNDTRGHESGDALLKQVATRINGMMNDLGYAARIGGDEFIIVMQGPRWSDSNSSNWVEEFAHSIAESVNEPYDLEGLSYNCSMSIGGAIMDSSGQSAESLIQQADHAMYQAKSKGKNQFVLYSSSDRSIS